MPDVAQNTALAECVYRGAAWLDHAAPGWASRVDLDRFDVHSARDDVPGQLFGHYGRGPDGEAMSEKDCIRRGFTVGTVKDWPPDGVAQMDALGAAWRDAVKARNGRP